MLTEAILHQMWPNGDTNVPGLIAKIAADAPAIFTKYRVDTDMAVAHIMAQFTVECGGGDEMTENIDYTPERACQVWDTRFTDADDCLNKVGSFRDDPNFKFKLIDFVYGGKNGNTQPHDGSTYIGRGLSQVTGRGNYRELAAKLDNRFDLVNNPSLVIARDNVLECGVADFVMCGCLPFAKSDDVIEVSQHLNGGFVGFAARTQSLVKWKQVLGVTPAKSGTMLWVQQSLNTLGASPQLLPDSIYGDGSKMALKAFQVLHHLQARNGLPTRETVAAIKTALPQA